MAINRITKLLSIDFPIIQAGMIWVSGSKLAAASANAGILGVIGAGSMKPDLLSTHIQKAKSLTQRSLAVNVPLLYEGAAAQIETALNLGIRIFITSAGSPGKFTEMLKNRDCIVGHVVSHPKLAQKCEAAGVDFVVAEGFEAGGHNGRDEITTLVLIPQVVDAVKIPVVAAGGIGDGRGIAAALALGAEGVQMGTRFICCEESSAHPNYRQALIECGPDATMLCMKSLVPVRLLKNDFYNEIKKLEDTCQGSEAIAAHLGKGRAKLGMLEGDLSAGELEVGQISGMVHDIPKVKDLVTRLIAEFKSAQSRLSTF